MTISVTVASYRDDSGVGRVFSVGQQILQVASVCEHKVYPTANYCKNSKLQQKYEQNVQTVMLSDFHYIKIMTSLTDDILYYHFIDII